MDEKILLWPEGRTPYMEECAGQPAPTLEAFPAEGSKGAVVVCPGGGYTHKAQHEGAPIARMLQEAGVSAYVLDYRVAPCPYETPLGDAQRAVRTVRAMGYEKVAILGFSAGGNLACCAATLWDLGCPEAEDPIERQSCRPDGLISCYSVVSMTQHTHIGSVKSLLGEQAGSVVLQRRFSAERNVTKDTPPAFIWHTASDGAVPVENSLNLAAAMSLHGVPFELHIFPEGRHGLGLSHDVPAAAQWVPLCRRWLKDGGYTAE
ncbi:MAG: alpha/beta hydrolase [Clostridia bacterium]|nr:alpha/beta hydrolase [Clostridia bacterium]